MTKSGLMLTFVRQTFCLSSAKIRLLLCRGIIRPHQLWHTTMAHAQQHGTASTSTEIQVDSLTDDPDGAWDRLSVQSGRIHRSLDILPLDAPKPPDTVRFVCISDTHSRLQSVVDKLNAIEKPDVLIHAGDFTRQGDLNEIRRFNAELGSIDIPRRIVVAGNHELSFDDRGGQRRYHRLLLDKVANEAGEKVKQPSQLLTNATYLEDQSCRVHGYNIYGAPHTPEFMGWAFNVKRGQPLLQLWNRIPKQTDILITHGPPVGYGDRIVGGYSVGCVELLSTVERRVRPLVHVFGHIHESYGCWTNGTTTFVNASTCNKYYKPVNDPIIIDLPVRTKTSKSRSPQPAETDTAT